MKWTAARSRRPRGLRARSAGRDTQRKDYPLGGIPVEYKGAKIPPPDERRGYN